MTASLRRIFAVASREFFASLASPAAWVFLVIFLVMANVCTFVFSDILALGQAELSPFFNWMPWLFMFLMPALGMPLWAEERRRSSSRSPTRSRSGNSSSANISRAWRSSRWRSP